MKRRFLAAALALSLLTGCTGAEAADLMQGIRASQSENTVLTESAAAAITDFGVRLLADTAGEGTSTLVSPLSVLSALGMTALGAEGKTLAQMEAVFGLSADELASAVSAWQTSLPQTQKCTLRLANAVWFTDDARFTVRKEFLQKNADHYGADAWRIPFDDSAVRTVNDWVSEHTDGQIQKILDQLSSDAVMLLVNALSFDAEWDSIYYDHQVNTAKFTRADGSSVKTKMMYSDEYSYLEDEHAAGFIKYYKGRDYAFAALLPEEGMSVADYLAALTGEKLHALLSSPEKRIVETGIPSFESETSAELSAVLSAMGMTDAFRADAADFSGIGGSDAGNIFISRVVHKTAITVDERGTKAGAATLVEMVDGAAALTNESKRVILDRPFVYMLIDCESSLPFFIGTMMDPTA